jgi:hypothetical protein
MAVMAFLWRCFGSRLRLVREKRQVFGPLLQDRPARAKAVGKRLRLKVSAPQ